MKHLSPFSCCSHSLGIHIHCCILGVVVPLSNLHQCVCASQHFFNSTLHISDMEQKEGKNTQIFVFRLWQWCRVYCVASCRQFWNREAALLYFFLLLFFYGFLLSGKNRRIGFPKYSDVWQWKSVQILPTSEKLGGSTCSISFNITKYCTMEKSLNTISSSIRKASCSVVFEEGQTHE